MVLGDTCLAAREVSLDILHRNVQDGRNGNKHAMVPTRQDVLMAAAAVAVVDVADVTASMGAADASAAAAADIARGAAKPTASADDDTGGLCLRACREHCHDLRGPVEPRPHAPGRCLAASHL